ncbi:MAG: SDR family oxidoreductase [Coriobacteriia bacterium]
MKPLLVTGATGNVGSLVIAALRARGADVRAASRSGRACGGAPGVVLDFRDARTFHDALDGVDTVFLVRPPQMSDAREMRPFIDAMAAAGVARVVFLSVQGAGTNPFVPHHGIERALVRSGIAWTFLRPSFFMQNLSTTHATDIRERDEVFVPAGRGRTNFIDVADIAEAAAVVLAQGGHAGKAYELTGSAALTYTEVAEAISRACGRTIIYPVPSSRQFARRMREAGHDAAFIRVMGSIYLIARMGMAGGTTNELEVLLGRRPTTFEEFARRDSECWDRRVTAPGR